MGEIILKEHMKEEMTYAELGDKSTFKGYGDAEEAGRGKGMTIGIREKIKSMRFHRSQEQTVFRIMVS